MKKLFLPLIIATVIFGCLLRLVKIQDWPIGFNQDEASIAYEAYSIANYGIDRNGKQLPVHLISWGSGQNALYAYLAIPFIKIFGNTIFAARLPMALIGCLTMSLFALIIYKSKLNKQQKLLAIFVAAVFPWHAIKSRWGLESNLFPDLIFYAALCFYCFLKTQKKRHLICSAIILGLSTYAYGTSYVYVPVFLVALIAFFSIKKQLKISHSLIFAGTTTAIALPMIAFVIINYFNLPEFKLFGIFTVPRLDYNRFTEITSVNGNFAKNCIKNLITSAKITFFQDDGLPLNRVPHFGIFYFFSLPFIIYGMILSAKNRFANISQKINLSALIAAVIVSAMVDPNINRINILWMPLFFYLCEGLIAATKSNRAIFLALTSSYAISASLLISNYVKDYQNSIASHTYVDARSAILEVNENANKADKIYVDASVNYTLYLYFAEANTNDYYNNREIAEKNVMFQRVLGFNNVKFKKPSVIKQGNIYLLHTNDAAELNHGECEQKDYANYSVINCTNN